MLRIVCYTMQWACAQDCILTITVRGGRSGLTLRVGLYSRSGLAHTQGWVIFGVGLH